MKVKKLTRKDLNAIEKHFHDVLLEIERKLSHDGPAIILPRIDHMYRGRLRSHLPIGGMMGGVRFEFVEKDGATVLFVAASTRMDADSEMHWHIDANGATKTFFTYEVRLLNQIN